MKKGNRFFVILRLDRGIQRVWIARSSRSMTEDDGCQNDKKWVFSEQNDNAGFTLIELIIAMTVILIVSLGFFGWASTIIQTNLSIERNNTAYSMAMDVAGRLQRMSDNSLIQHSTASKRYVGFTSDGDLRGCDASNDPTVVISSGLTGMTTYTNPTQSSNSPYLYDKNNCEGRTWVDNTNCGDYAKVSITSAANGNIDHPNTTITASSYNSISPIRSYRNTTYYAVWSVAYMPCNAGTDTSRRKIFVTVYWINPEPTDAGVADVQTKIGNGTYTVKSVSVVVDKSIGTEG